MSDFYNTLNLFSEMVGMCDKSTNEEGVLRLVELLEDAEPTILGTKKGPEFHSLLKRFGLIAPFKGQEKLDEVDPEIVMPMLTTYEKFKIACQKHEAYSLKVILPTIENLLPRGVPNGTLRRPIV